LSRTNVSSFSFQKTGQEQLFKKTFCGMFADQKICKECNHRWAAILKLTNNSSRLNKGNQDRDGVWISDLNEHRVLRFCHSVFSLVLVSIEKIYQTLKTAFHYIFERTSEFIKNTDSATRFTCNSVLDVWKRSKAWSFMFDRSIGTSTVWSITLQGRSPI